MQTATLEPKLHVVSPINQHPMPSQPSESISTDPIECEMCFGSGYEPVGNGVRVCLCRKERILAFRLAAIPERFRAIELDSIAPRTAQIKALESLKQNPLGNAVLAGGFGSGKTMLSYALYREIAIKHPMRRIVFTTFAKLLNEMRMFIQASMSGQELPRVLLTAEDLLQGHPYSIFIDDLDKARPTEYAAEQLFEIINAIYEHRHQLVITTNLRPADLVSHFNQADERYGGAIVRRICEGAYLAEMFN